MLDDHLIQARELQRNRQRKPARCFRIFGWLGRYFQNRNLWEVMPSKEEVLVGYLVIAGAPKIMIQMKIHDDVGIRPKRERALSITL